MSNHERHHSRQGDAAAATRAHRPARAGLPIRMSHVLGLQRLAGNRAVAGLMTDVRGANPGVRLRSAGTAPHLPSPAAPRPMEQLGGVSGQAGNDGSPTRENDGVASVAKRPVDQYTVAPDSRVDSVGGPVTAQRQPRQRERPPLTERWELEEKDQTQSTIRRTTTIEVTAWEEVGPGRPRVLYKREVDMTTVDGVKIRLDISATVLLTSAAGLPTSPEAALHVRGKAVRNNFGVHVEGGDVIDVNDGNSRTVPDQSLASLTAAVLPEYAKLPLTVKQQEAAIRAYVSKLPRKPKQPAPSEDDRSTAGVIADIGTDFLPIIGELKDLYRAVTGTDPVTGKKLQFWERALALLGALPLIGKLAKGASKAAKFLGRGLSWLMGKTGIEAWFVRQLAKWHKSRQARRLADAIDKAQKPNKARKAVKAGSELIKDGEGFIAIIDKEGKIIARESFSYGHQELVKRTYKSGKLPDGEAFAVTIGKEHGEIYVLSSWNVHDGTMKVPTAAVEGLKDQFH